MHHGLHLCATLPNVRIMEIDIDDVPCRGIVATRVSPRFGPDEGADATVEFSHVEQLFPIGAVVEVLVPASGAHSRSPREVDAVLGDRARSGCVAVAARRVDVLLKAGDPAGLVVMSLTQPAWLRR